MKQLDIFMDPNVPLDHFPSYQTEGAAGFDLSAWLPTGSIIIPAYESRIVNTGIYMMIPEGHEVQIRSRSGLAGKHALFVLNSPGTIDCDYRGEIRVILTNMYTQKYVVASGDRIAQGVLKEAPQANLVRVNSIRHDTARGEHGLGSTGK